MKINELDNILIGLLLLSLLSSIYSYHNSDHVKKEELNWVSGTLSEIPYEGSHGGETSYPYVMIRFKEFSNKFYIDRCSYSSLALEQVRELQIGDNLKIGYLGVQKFKNDLYVYEISSSESPELLSFLDFNSCSRGKWKVGVYLSLTLGLVLIYRFIKNHFIL